MGGNNGSTAMDTVDYAPINSGGPVGVWSTTTALPGVVDNATSVTYNGYVYVMGGNNGSTAMATVDYAPINSNGTLGAWSSTTALPQTLDYATSVEYDGYIYIMGGESSSIQATVDYAPINSNGTLGAWSSTTALPQTLSLATSVAYNGYVYVTGGSNGSTESGNTYYAQLITNFTYNGMVTTNAKLCIYLSSCSSSLGVSGNIAATGTITGGVSSPDYAEEITASDPSITAGDVVAMDPNNPGQVIKSNMAYDPNLLGVISTHPGFITNAIAGTVNGTNNPNTNQRPLALAGRVPVKVSTQNGPINIGDYLTSSSIPGVAMKATEAGPVIGRAMSSYNGTTIGSVIVYIAPSYYNPSNSQTLQANNIIANMLTVNSAINASSINDSNLLTTKTLNVIGSATIGGDLTINGGLSVEGMTTVSDITINGHIITSGKTPTVSILPSAGTNATVTITGNDTSGTITITTGSTITTTNSNGQTIISGNNPGIGGLVSLIYDKSYTLLPHVIITPNDAVSAGMEVYPASQNDKGFTVGVDKQPLPNTVYTFEYFVVQ